MRICLPGGPSKLSPMSIRYRPRKKLALPERLKRLHVTCVAQGNGIVMRYAEIASLRFYCCRSRGRAVARDITVGTKFIKAYKTCRPCNWRAIKSCPENEDSRGDDNASWSPIHGGFKTPPFGRCWSSPAAENEQLEMLDDMSVVSNKRTCTSSRIVGCKSGDCGLLGRMPSESKPTPLAEMTCIHLTSPPAGYPRISSSPCPSSLCDLPIADRFENCSAL